MFVIMLPKVSKTGYKLPKVSKTGYKLPKVSKTGYKLPKVSKTGYKLPKVSKTGYIQTCNEKNKTTTPDAVSIYYVESLWHYITNNEYT